MVKGLPDIHFFEGVFEGCILGKHPEEKFERGRQGETYLPWSLFTVISWVHLHIRPSSKQGMFLHLLMITHTILGSIFSGKSLKVLSISKTSKL
jgi:hypothetical protein